MVEPGQKLNWNRWGLDIKLTISDNQNTFYFTQSRGQHVMRACAQGLACDGEGSGKQWNSEVDVLSMDVATRGKQGGGPTQSLSVVLCWLRTSVGVKPLGKY